MTTIKPSLVSVILSATLVLTGPSITQAQDMNCSQLASGCTNIPQEVLDKQRPLDPERDEAWRKCVASIIAAGVPAAKAESIIRGALQGLGAGALSGYAGCDFDKINGDA